jgi:hypothetical protein
MLLYRGVSHFFSKGVLRVLMRTDGAVLGSIIVLRRIASSFMEQRVMQTQFQPGPLRQALRDPSLGQYHTVDLEYMIVSLMEVSRCLLGRMLAHNYDSDVAFTFDDGPYNYTSDLLDKLAVYNASATFMVTGNNLGKGIWASYSSLTCR